MNITLSRIALMSAITLTGSNALAQANAGTPAAVGTTSQAAADATQKAVPRSDTGTVVRTSPSAVDKARQVAPAPPPHRPALPARSTPPRLRRARVRPGPTGTDSRQFRQPFVIIRSQYEHAHHSRKQRPRQRRTPRHRPFP